MDLEELGPGVIDEMVRKVVKQHDVARGRWSVASRGKSKAGQVPASVRPDVGAGLVPDRCLLGPGFAGLDGLPHDTIRRNLPRRVPDRPLESHDLGPSVGIVDPSESKAIPVHSHAARPSRW
jgi:hypothetical protein